MFRDNITLSCPARGTPLVDTVWTRGGVELDSSFPRVTVQSTTLHITMATVDDSGDYNCTVSNTVRGEMFVESYVQRLEVQSE